MIGITTAVAAIIAFVLTAVLGAVMIPYLRRLKYGQTILEIGPRWHKSKQGTPTMGGIIFIIGILAGIIIAVVAYANIWNDIYNGETVLSKVRLWGGVFLCAITGAIGFFDDYLKVVKKQNQGLSASQKMFMQLLAGAAYAITLYMAGDTVLNIPFIGSFDIGLFYIPLVIFLVAGFNNAVNLTDGIDGLASSVTFIYSVTFMLIAGVIYRNAGMSIFGAAVAGGCLAFLLWNFHPAKVFMGDTGSLFLGGAVCALAFGIGQPLLLLPAGIVYILETLSVILQVTHFKITKGKRLFKMAPLHHHLEMCGYSEIKVVSCFCFITLIGCAAAFILCYLG